jgi:serine/threonine protein kinase
MDPLAGYSKAVDMWSVGCIAATLLTGDVIFTDRDHPQYQKNPGRIILDLAAKCDLTQMMSDPVWDTVGHRAKDFLRRLLVLEEDQRMAVNEALQHRWFTNKKHRARFESIYNKSIRHWRPSKLVGDLVEDLDATGNGRTSLPNLAEQASIAQPPAMLPVHLVNVDVPTLLQRSENQAIPQIGSYREQVNNNTTEIEFHASDQLQHETSPLPSSPDISQSSATEEAESPTLSPKASFLHIDLQMSDFDLADYLTIPLPNPAISTRRTSSQSVSDHQSTIAQGTSTYKQQKRRRSPSPELHSLAVWGTRKSKVTKTESCTIAS